MEPFATLAELTARLDWTLDEDETRIASAALEDLSDQARHYGLPWTDPTTTPRMVRSLVLSAAVRYMRNPDGYTQSRAGDETLMWTDLGANAGSAHFNETEIKALRKMAGATGLATAPMTAWGTMRPRVRIATQDGYMDVPAPGYVPVPGSSEPFPYYADPQEPW
jgi:hypothetical protein